MFVLVKGDSMVGWARVYFIAAADKVADVSGRFCGRIKREWAAAVVAADAWKRGAIEGGFIKCVVVVEDDDDDGGFVVLIIFVAVVDGAADALFVELVLGAPNDDGGVHSNATVDGRKIALVGGVGTFTEKGAVVVAVVATAVARSGEMDIGSLVRIDDWPAVEGVMAERIRERRELGYVMDSFVELFVWLTLVDRIDAYVIEEFASEPFINERPRTCSVSGISDVGREEYFLSSFISEVNVVDEGGNTDVDWELIIGW